MFPCESRTAKNCIIHDNYALADEYSKVLHDDIT